MSDELILSTGAKVSANCGLISLSSDGMIYEGYDGQITYKKFFSGPNDWETTLTNNERLEIAEHMIARWKDYAEELRHVISEETSK